MIRTLVLEHLQPPYLVVRVVPRMFHLRALPADMPNAELNALARAQASANRMDTCLVTKEGARYFVMEAPREGQPQGMPFDMLNHWSAVPSCDQLQAAASLPPTRELEEREALLAILVEEYRDRRQVLMRERGMPTPSPFVFGDLTKGGHEPSGAELLELSARDSSGLPPGLDRCSVCWDWRGEYLDEIDLVGTRVVPVHCRCDNENSCARCGGRLAYRRLNGNYYKASTDAVWHVPGFEGLKHACQDAGTASPKPGGHMTVIPSENGSVESDGGR